MNIGEKLKLVLATVKVDVCIDVNDHRGVYQTAAQRLEEAAQYDCPPEITDDVRRQMIETDTIVTITFHPKNPVSFYDVWHHDLDAALDEALECLRQEGLLS